MYTRWMKIWSCLVSIVMFFYWSMVVAQWVIWGGINHCGDWVLRVDLWEMCDDWNYLDNDWCSRNCEDESLVKTEEAVPVPTINPAKISDTTWYKVFMHGQFSHTQSIPGNIGSLTWKEACDYGLKNWVICEPWYGGTCYYCTESCQLEEVVWFMCGDGIVYNQLEQCDDGNLNSGDGCSSTCTKENVHVVKPLNNSQPSFTDTLVQPEPQIVDQQVVIQQEIVVVNEVITQEPRSLFPETNTALVLEPYQAEIVSEVNPVETIDKTTSPVLTLKPVVIKKVNEDNLTESTEQVMTPLVLPSTSTVVNLDKNNISHIKGDKWPWWSLGKQMNIRHNIVTRTSPINDWIWVTSPYPENLSKTGARVLLSSEILFMWLVSLLCMLYTTSFFVRKSVN